MTASNAQIERLVREVLERLGHELRGENQPAGAGHHGAAKDHSASKNNGAAKNGTAPQGAANVHRPAASVPPPAAHALVLHQKLVALADVEGRVPQGSSVAVAARAVITPAARDYLRAAGARLEIATARAGASAAASARRTLSLAAASGAAGSGAAQRLSLELPDRLASHLASAGLHVERIAHVSLPITVSEIADSVALGGNLGLLLTDETAAALCLANRRRGVRAAAAATLPQLEAACTAIAVNLLVLNPAGTSSWQLMQLARQYASLAGTGSAAKYPEVLA